jgi:hypothetical protein
MDERTAFLSHTLRQMRYLGVSADIRHLSARMALDAWRIDETLVVNTNARPRVQVEYASMPMFGREMPVKYSRYDPDAGTFTRWGRRKGDHAE